MAKGLAYHPPGHGEKFQVYSEKEKKLVTYKVDVIPMSRGINAYGFKSLYKGSQAQPILLFRRTMTLPSGEGSMASVVTDTDPRGLGYGTYKGAQKEIKQWVDIGKESHGKVIFTGHSLGNAFATYAGIDTYEKVEVVVGFGATKVSGLYRSKWEKIKNQLTIVLFNLPGDQLTKVGQVRLATRINEVEISDFPEIEKTGLDTKATSCFSQYLTSIRPASASHRVCGLDKKFTIYEKDISPCSDWTIRAIFETALFCLLFPFLWIIHSAKLFLVGNCERGGVFDLFQEIEH